MQKTIYISGKITGTDDYENRFAKVEVTKCLILYEQGNGLKDI